MKTKPKEFKITETNRKSPRCGSSHVVKTLFAIVCTVVMIFHTSEVLSDYLRFDSMIMIENESHSLSIAVPAISICQKYPLLKIVRENHESNIRLPVKYVLGLKKIGLISIYKGVISLDIRTYKHKMKPKFKMFNILNTKFENISEETIRCLLDNEQTDCHPSFSSTGSMSQCQTYFSEIGSDGRIVERSERILRKNGMTVEVSKIAFFAFNFTDYYRDKVGLKDIEPFVIVHSPRALVSSETAAYTARRFVLRPNKSFDLSYSRKTTVKLQKPYQTDCHYYGSPVNSTDIYGHSREMCLNQCVLDRIVTRFGCLVTTVDVIRDDKYSQMKICNSTVLFGISKNNVYETEFMSRIYCHKICKPECYEEVYDYDLNEVEDPNLFDIFNISYNNSDMSFINVLTKKTSRSLHYHSPKMKLTDFLCCIGGLFSLWLGLSVLNLYDFITFIYLSCKRNNN